MIRIICTECKNAYLQNKEGNLICPSCNATYEEEKENLLLGVQYYNEENYSEADNCFMKYIVKNSTEPLSIFYKAFCDGRNFDEDTISLQDTYKKILDAFADVSDEKHPEFIALANDEIAKIEKLLAESHVRLFADADAEAIKKQVEIILNIQNEAKAFRNALSDLVAKFNERSDRKISAKFSDCYFIENEIAAEVGDIKYQKICDNVASHTVFTGILTNDIKNLEIYLRCIVMFFQKSYDKYTFLKEQSEKFTKLAELLELGQYNTIKGIGAVADKLKSISYDFLQESCKEHFDEQIDMQTETVVVLEPEIIEEHDTTEEIVEEVIEEVVEVAEAEEINREIVEEVCEEPVSEETVCEEADNETEEETIEEIIISDSDVIEIPVEESDEAEEETEPEDISSATPIAESIEEPQPEIQEEETLSEPSVEIEEECVEEAVSEQEEIADDAIVEIEEIVPDNFEKVEADEAIINGEAQKSAIINPKKKKSRKAIVIVLLVIILAGVFAGYKYGPEFINSRKYEKATKLADAGKYTEAIAIFNELDSYSDSQEKAIECEYNNALKLEESGKYAEAKLVFESLGDYGDSKTRAQACAYSEAKDALENKNFETATKLFVDLGDYGDSKEMVKECSYRRALALIENKEYESAIEILTTIRKYSDAKDKITEAKYMYVTDNFDKKNKTTVKYLNELTKDNYRNSADLRKELLGSAEVTSTDVKVFVNYSSTDLETSLTELDNTKPIYFHAVVGDKALYGKTLTLKYTTAFGYTQRKTVTLSESDNVAVMSYPATQYKNYTVEFELSDSSGQKIAGQKISF